MKIELIHDGKGEGSDAYVGQDWKPDLGNPE